MNIIKYKKPERITKKRNNSAVSKGARKRNYKYSNQQITDMLAIPISVKIHAYGVNNLYYVRGQKINDFVDTTSVGDVIETTPGDCRTLGCLPGRQVYFEDVALKFRESTTSTSSTIPPWTYNLDAMLIKAYNDGRIWSPHTTQPTTSFTADSAKILNRFMYHGGSVIHKFTNTLNTTAYMEFREFTPRQIQPGYLYLEGQVNYAKNDGMYRTLGKDLTVQNQGQSAPSANTDAFDQFDDKGFKYNNKCLITNSRWVVGPPILVKLMPGETYTYKMVLHPFSFKTSEFMLLLTGQSDNNMNGTDQLPVELPGFTKHLYMRAWGEANVFSVHDKWNDTQIGSNTLLDPMPTDNLNSVESPVQQLDRVSTSSVRLAHSRSEYHRFRASTFNNLTNTAVIRDFRDWGTTKYVPGTDPPMYSVDSQETVLLKDINDLPGTDSTNMDQTTNST